MKVALITDTHFGVRNDAPEFLYNAKRFLDDVFFPRIKEAKVDKIIHLGDLLDRKKFINFETAQFTRTHFIEPCLSIAPMDLMVGNHDSYHFKDSNRVNGPTELFGHYDGLKIFWRGPAEMMLGDTKALYLPWINHENRMATFSAIEQTNAKLCFAHMDVAGFEMHRGTVCADGLSPALFKKFDMTFSGHFHRKGEQNGLHYLGSSGEYDWHDWNNPSGFHIFDVEKRRLKFFQNPYTVFVKIHYSDDAPQEVIEDIRHKHVKVIVRERKDQVAFEAFIAALERNNPAKLTTVDDHLNKTNILDSIGDLEGEEDTLTILRNAAAEVMDEPEALSAVLEDLYKMALDLR